MTLMIVSVIGAENGAIEIQNPIKKKEIYYAHIIVTFGALAYNFNFNFVIILVAYIQKVLH